MAFARSFLYHKDTPLGRIFETEAEYLGALDSGWKEAPWLVNEKDVATKVEGTASKFVDRFNEHTYRADMFDSEVKIPVKTRKPRAKRITTSKLTPKLKTETINGPEITYID
jgi:hypothetical protein